MLRRNTNAFGAHWRVALLVLVAIMVWIAHFDRWTLASWNVPTDYYVDAHETLARLKAASEGDIWPLRSQVIERLGAPFGAHWNACPTPDKPLMLALGGLVHLVGLYAAANLGLVLAQVLGALAFYFTARWLRCRWEWAAAGALLFAYTYHTFHRGLAHMSLVFTWTIPLGLLAVWLIAGSRRLEWNRPAAWLCLATAAAFGASNPYNLFFWLQLMGWALVIQAFGARRRANLQIGVAAFFVAFAAFAIVHAEGWLHADDTGALPLLARNYGGTERYALKPVEMFIPPPFHRWEWMAFFGHRYARWSEWRGEVFLPYLGLAGIAGLLWLACATVRKIIARRPLPGQSLTLGWIIAYSAIGGLTNVLALFASFQLFRATNRAAIFVSAIVLLFLVVRLSRVSIRWPRWLQVLVPVIVAAIGLFDQIPRPDDPRDVRAVARMVEDDREFGRRLESALPDGAMVFQLPVMGFPEVLPPHELNDYEHFRPYLATHDLRFTYGAPKSRARSRWQSDLENAPTAELVQRLEEFGFSALYINRKGYPDRAASLLAELAGLGYKQRIVGGSEHQVVVPLRPEREHHLPMGNSVTLGRGWQQRADKGVRWADSEAAISYFNPFPHSVTVDFRLVLQAVSAREVIVERDGKFIARINVSTEPSPLVLPKFELLPGVNRFTVRSDAGAVRLGVGQNQLRSFGLKDSSVRLISDKSGSGTVAAAR